MREQLVIVAKLLAFCLAVAWPIELALEEAWKATGWGWLIIPAIAAAALAGFCACEFRPLRRWIFGDLLD